MLARKSGETYPVAIVCQGWADVLDRAFNEDAANEAKALAVGIFGQRLVQCHQNETAEFHQCVHIADAK